MEAGFRAASEDDLPAIVDTYNKTIPSLMVTADLEPVSVESRNDWFRSHDPGRRPLWVVETGGNYAGWISFRSFYGRPAYNGVAEVAIYLEPRYQGKGLGKACLGKIISEAPALGIHTLLGFIFAHNEPSIKLFEKMGFQKWGHLPGIAEMKDKMRDLVIFGRKVAVNRH